MTLSATAFAVTDGDMLLDSTNTAYTVVDGGTRLETDNLLGAPTLLELEAVKGAMKSLDPVDLTGLDPRIVSFMEATRRDLVELYRRIDGIENYLDKLDTE